MADQRWAHRALQTFLVVALLASALWAYGPRAHAADVPSCPSTDFSLDDAQQTIPFFWETGGAVRDGAGSMHVTIPRPGRIMVSDGIGLRTYASAGTYGIDLTPPNDMEELYKAQQSKVEQYEVTFTPYIGDGTYAGESVGCLKPGATSPIAAAVNTSPPQTTSIDWVPAKAPSTTVGCVFTVEYLCYEREVTLSIAEKGENIVFSGEITTEAAGGTSCSGGAVYFQKRRSDGSWGRAYGPFLSSKGVYSKKFDNQGPLKYRRWLQKGTFRTEVQRVGYPYSKQPPLCGAAVSAPVKR